MRLFAVLVVALAALTACGPEPAGPAPTASPVVAPTSTTAQPGGKAEVVPATAEQGAAPLDTTGADLAYVPPEFRSCLTGYDLTLGEALYETARVEEGGALFVLVEGFDRNVNGRPDVRGFQPALLRARGGQCESLLPDYPMDNFSLAGHLSEAAYYDVTLERLGWRMQVLGGLEGLRERLQEEGYELVECPSSEQGELGNVCIEPVEAAALREAGLDIQPPSR